ncbi:uncharacterized protein [Miscanthus floridulus]|uniref:uncharacterized protein n=1 Tax=Miscanthus floridulus TaxID=154761 RepID=UPI00345840FB
MESVRVLLALAAQEVWHVHHMDAKSTFLNGDLKEEVYVQQLPRFAVAGEEGKDLEVEVFKAHMKKIFDMSDLRLLSFYLSVEVCQDANGITLRQTHYAKRILELGGMAGCNPTHTPMEERLLVELLGRHVEVVELKMDSKSALALAKNLVFHERSKHIRIKYHFIRSCLEDGSIKAEHIPTTNQLADILTKSLGKAKFEEMRERIGLKQISSKTEHKAKGEK